MAHHRIGILAATVFSALVALQHSIEIYAAAVPKVIISFAGVNPRHDLRLIASFTNKLTYTMIARPEIKRAEDLRGKRFGVQAIGGSVWMGAVLGLEHLGMEQRRDNINISSSRS
jgi:ABC-type nitrate/sulfonate/bicarbonate transport system substrate-binding protein